MAAAQNAPSLPNNPALGDRMNTPWPVVDTHCHVIAPDNTRYPLQPMGGK